jgi:hypothetical protein
LPLLGDDLRDLLLCHEAERYRQVTHPTGVPRSALLTAEEAQQLLELGWRKVALLHRDFTKQLSHWPPHG